MNCERLRWRWQYKFIIMTARRAKIYDLQPQGGGGGAGLASCNPVLFIASFFSRCLWGGKKSAMSRQPVQYQAVLETFLAELGIGGYFKC